MATVGPERADDALSANSQGPPPRCECRHVCQKNLALTARSAAHEIGEPGQLAGDGLENRGRHIRA